MKIALSIGHGKRVSTAGIIVYDPGAVYYGISEHDICLEIGEMIHTLCSGIPGLDLAMIPVGTLQEKVAHVNALVPDALLELHFNSATDTKVRGVETLYFPGSPKGRKIAVEILGYIANLAALSSRGIKEREDLYILKKTRCPAVVVELEFLSNENVARELKEGFLRQRLAYAVSYGLFKLSREWP